MAGNGYFANGQYQPKSTETWDDYDASSAGVDWDGFTTWAGTPSLPLTFTTGVVDFGRKDKVIPLTNVRKTGLMTTTIYYGDSVDSAGGAIDAPSSLVVNVGDTVGAINARYFQFSFSLGYDDSAGAGPVPAIYGITTDLNAEKITASFDSINSSTLAGSTGVRQLSVDQPISPTVVTVTPHNTSSDPYIESGYVADGYVEAGTVSRPIIYLDKSTSPITLKIYELDTYGKTKLIDCTFDAMVAGLPTASADVEGNITRG